MSTGGRFRDKVAFITGAGSGIGHATAQAFASEGASVVPADRSEAHNQETACSVRPHQLRRVPHLECRGQEHEPEVTNHSVDSTSGGYRCPGTPTTVVIGNRWGNCSSAAASPPSASRRVQPVRQLTQLDDRDPAPRRSQLRRSPHAGRLAVEHGVPGVIVGDGNEACSWAA